MYISRYIYYTPFLEYFVTGYDLFMYKKLNYMLTIHILIQFSISWYISWLPYHNISRCMVYHCTPNHKYLKIKCLKWRSSFPHAIPLVCDCSKYAKRICCQLQQYPAAPAESFVFLRIPFRPSACILWLAGNWNCTARLSLNLIFALAHWPLGDVAIISSTIFQLKW